MATSSFPSISNCFPSRIVALARSNNHKPFKRLTSRKPNTKKLNPILTSSPPPPPPLSSGSGGEATTYTRLPPKDDHFFTHQDDVSTEIKLSDSITIPKKRKQKKPKRKTKIVEEFGSDEEDEVGFDYGKFELFEVNSEVEFDDEGYDDEELGFESKVEEEEEERVKEKGLPAVMRCFDRAKIYVRAGDGGNGVVAFRREKFVPFGGPSGGDGGRGGNVYMEADGSMNSLLPFRQSIHFRAGRGGHGQGSSMNGAKGEDVVVKVPPGTVVREAGKDGELGEVLLEFLNAGDRGLLLPGGRGGRGNASFKSGTNKVPRIAENGEEGPEM